MNTKITNNKIYIFLIIILAALTFGAPLKVWGQKDPDEIIRKKRRELYYKQQKLEYERYRLQIMNNRQRDVADQLSSTQNQVARTRENLDSLVVRIRKLNLQIKSTQKKIFYLEQKLSAHRFCFSNRMRDIYENSDENYLSALLDSEDFSDFITRMEFLKLIIDYDLNLLNDIETEHDDLTAEKLKLQSREKELRKVQQKVTEKKIMLNSLEGKRSELLNEISWQKNQVYQNVVQLENSSAELEAKIRDIIRSSSPTNVTDYSYGNFMYPVNAYINSGFGYRVHPISGATIFHTGIDLAAGYGVTIKATASGVVIFSGWNGGYGNTVIIDHGGGLTSLYGHCSALYVSRGQQVSKGQSIAAVGSTGYSTGPHLHFEIRQNGEPIDPRSKLR